MDFLLWVPIFLSQGRGLVFDPQRGGCIPPFPPPFAHVWLFPTNPLLKERRIVAKKVPTVEKNNLFIPWDLRKIILAKFPKIHVALRTILGQKKRKMVKG